MLIPQALFLEHGAYNAQSLLRLDPSRTAAQIVTGIGFLGAGVILKEGATVRGLTTAATLWVVAGLGRPSAWDFSLWNPLDHYRPCGSAFSETV